MVLALVLGVLAAIIAAQPAHARIVSVAFSFPGLAPGEERSDSAAVPIPHDARLVAVEIAEQTSAPGTFRWSATLCPPTGRCLPVQPAIEGAEVVAGEHTLDVTVALDVDADALASSTVTGRLVFSDDADDDGLPPTGVVVGSLVALAAALLAGGTAFVGVSRRRQVPRA